jgi:tyrosine-protein phosphatase YwqE
MCFSCHHLSQYLHPIFRTVKFQQYFPNIVKVEKKKNIKKKNLKNKNLKNKNLKKKLKTKVKLREELIDFINTFH